MGKLLTSKSSAKISKTGDKAKAVSKKELYKPISEFKWQDANQAEIHQNSIEVYRKRFAF